MTDKPLWTQVASDANAEPIRILDLDVAKTTWSRVHESMRVVHLKLNRQPDLPWSKFFHEERESRIGARRRGLWIEDGYIAFDCLLVDVESHHLPDIRRSLDYANERALALVAARIRERGAQGASDRSERLELEGLRKRVREAVDPRARPAPPPAAPAPATPVLPVVDAAPPLAPPVAVEPAPLPATAVQEAAPAQPAPEAAAGEPAPPSLERRLDDYRSTLRAARRRSTDPTAVERDKPR